MNTSLIALCIQQGGSIITSLLSMKRPQLKSQDTTTLDVIEVVPAPEPEPEPVREVAELNDDQKISKGVACVPCSISHLLTCRGLLDEAHRMSHDGLTADGQERVDQCLGEIAAAERVDLSPANIAKLSGADQVIAKHTAKELREIRHTLEGLKTPEELAAAAAQTTELQKHVSREFFISRKAQQEEE